MNTINKSSPTSSTLYWRCGSWVWTSSSYVLCRFRKGSCVGQICWSHFWGHLLILQLWTQKESLKIFLQPDWHLQAEKKTETQTKSQYLFSSLWGTQILPWDLHGFGIKERFAKNEIDFLLFHRDQMYLLTKITPLSHPYPPWMKCRPAGGFVMTRITA